MLWSKARGSDSAAESECLQDVSVAEFSMNSKTGKLSARNSVAEAQMNKLNETELISLIRGLYLNKPKDSNEATAEERKDAIEETRSSLQQSGSGSSQKSGKKGPGFFGRKAGKEKDKRGIKKLWGSRQEPTETESLTSYEYLNDKQTLPDQINTGAIPPQQQQQLALPPHPQQRPPYPPYGPPPPPYAAGAGWARPPPPPLGAYYGYGPPQPGPYNPYGYLRARPHYPHAYPPYPAPPPQPQQALPTLPPTLPGSRNHPANVEDGSRHSYRSGRASLGSRRSTRSERREKLRKFLLKQNQLAAEALANRGQAAQQGDLLDGDAKMYNKRHHHQRLDNVNSILASKSMDHKNTHFHPKEEKYDLLSFLCGESVLGNDNNTAQCGGTCCVPRCLCNGKYCVFMF